MSILPAKGATFLRAVCVSYLALLSFNSLALELTGVTNSHDPSTLTRDGDTYFHFTTGQGIWYSTSTNLTHWEGGSTVFSNGWPAWIDDAVPGFEGEFWAPDVIQLGDYYYLYYSASTFGSSESAIGVVRTPSLKNPVWEDQGMVVQSYGGADEINAIDAALFRDHDGKVYMSYGSWFGGLGVAEIDQSTGKLASSVSHIYGGGHDSIEAPYITRNGDYYYLFFNRGKCCQGSDSTYYIQVARSSGVTGPYTDERSALPNEDGKYKGPGHIGVLKQDGCHYVSTHYYDLTDNGAAKLDILSMTYSGGWPSLTRNFDSITSCGGVSDGKYSFISRHSGKAIEVEFASPDNGANIAQYDYFGGLHQQWYVISHGDGRYSLINSGTLKSMDVWESSMDPGANIAQWDYWGGGGQKWHLYNLDGHIEVVSDLSGHALDVYAKSLDNHGNIIQWTRNGGTNQQWVITRRY